jgi:hypothetical protein
MPSALTTGQPVAERRGRRLPIELEVHVRPLPEGREQLLLSHDWSTSGVFVRTQHPMERGVAVELAVAMPRIHGFARFRGLVARSVTLLEEGEHHPPGMGIHFRELPVVLRDHLRRLAAARGDPHGHELPEEPVVVLVGHGPERIRHALYLEHNGFRVAECAGPLELARMLSSGLDAGFVAVMPDVGAGEIAQVAEELAVLPPGSRPRVLVVGGPDGEASREAVRQDVALVTTGDMQPERLCRMLRALVPVRQGHG